MSLEDTLTTALETLVASNQIYPDMAPSNAPFPRVVFQQVGGAAINFLDPTVPNLKNARIQIAAWGRTRTQAAALSRQIEDTIRTTTALRATVLGAPVAMHEPDTRLYGTRQDFSVFF